MEVELLMRMAAAVVRRNVAGDHDHRNRIERGVGDTGRGVGESGAEMAEHDPGFASDARVAIGRMSRYLLMTARDESNPALAQRIEDGNVGVPAQAEDHVDAHPLE